MHTYKPVNGSNLSLFSAQFLDAFLDLKKTELMSGKKKKKRFILDASWFDWKRNFSDFPLSSNSTLKVSCSRWIWLWGASTQVIIWKREQKRESRLSYLISAGGQRSAAGVHMIRSQVSVERGSPPRCGLRTAPRSPRLAIRSVAPH